jgi:hypothetical protein
VIDNVVGGEAALHVVAPANAEHVREALFSELWVGRARA